jgi:hypothetical protein
MEVDQYGIRQFNIINGYRYLNLLNLILTEWNLLNNIDIQNYISNINTFSNNINRLYDKLNVLEDYYNLENELNNIMSIKKITNLITNIKFLNSKKKLINNIIIEYEKKRILNNNISEYILNLERLQTELDNINIELNKHENNKIELLNDTKIHFTFYSTSLQILGL